MVCEVAASLGLRRAQVVVLASVVVMVCESVLGCAWHNGVPGKMWNWNQPFPAYRVIDNIYYVGSTEIAQFLITTPAGHILLDSGFEASVPRLRANIAGLGFRLEDVRLLLTSHAHIDHVQAHARVRQLTGAQVVASALDASVIAAGGKGEATFGDAYRWPPCPVDRIVADGEEVTLGGTTLTAHLTPGHTRGAVTWTMKIATPTIAPAQPLDVVFFPSATINPGVTLVGNVRYPRIADDFEHSFAVWRSLPCDVFLADHGDFYDMREKRARQERGALVNPFIDPTGYRKFIAASEQHFREVRAAQR
jgi:metallo-beta-lactamase class B